LAKPVIAIVGRPNVGKSTLFNYITGKKISIVDDTPGVTRDRIYSDFSWRSKEFILIDTGGIETGSDDEIKIKMRTQANIAIETADVIIFLVDLKTGVTPQDAEIAEILRKSGKKVVLTVNKADHAGGMPAEVFEFYDLSLGDLFAVSSEHRLGIGELLDEIYRLTEHINDAEEVTDAIRVAIIGKPNSGKSSLINKILGEERLIVSKTAGTTRDAVDTRVKFGDKEYIFIDTAGIRKHSKVSESIEYYSILRAVSAVERADVCLIMIDAGEGVTEQDTKVAGIAHESGKACLIVINKWDLIEKETKTLETYKKDVESRIPYMSYAPIVFISAKTGQRIGRLPELIDYVYDQSSLRITTGMLNDVINEAIAITPPPSHKGKRLKIFYMTQTGVRPPSFVIFINKKDLFHFSYQRYIENTLRKNFGFEGSPLKVTVREKGEKG
jgi:GTPase